MICPRCGNEIAEGTRRCPHCGALLRVVQSHMAPGQAGQASQAQAVPAQGSAAQTSQPTPTPRSDASSAQAAATVRQAVSQARAESQSARQSSGSARTSARNYETHPRDGVPAAHIGYFALGCFVVALVGLLGTGLRLGIVRPPRLRAPEPETIEEPAIEEWAVEAKNMVETYSWEDLAKIGQEITDARSESAAMDVAKHYNLVDASGRLDGSQTKTLELADGTVLTAQIVGIYHDDRADGSGKAGISFITKECVSTTQMNADGNIDGGWRDADLRALLDETYLPLLPDDLEYSIVTVSKATNNEGTSSEDAVAPVSTTSDRLWLPSVVEVAGQVEASQMSDQFEFGARIYNAEGSQYQLFRDTNCAARSENPQLVRKLGGYATEWWLRSPRPGSQHTFCTVTDVGDTPAGDGTAYTHGIVIAFSL